MKGPVELSLARRLRELRKHGKLSLDGLGAAIGVSKVAVWLYENAKTHIPVERLRAVARVMGCDEAEFHKPPGSPLPILRPPLPTLRAALRLPPRPGVRPEGTDPPFFIASMPTCVPVRALSGFDMDLRWMPSILKTPHHPDVC